MVTFEYCARTDACASRRCTPQAGVLGLAEMIYGRPLRAIVK
jgi:hypothetical protein